MRYQVETPEWCRTQWMSPEARALWEPRIKGINDAWMAAERASVGSFRKACLQNISPEQLSSLSAKVIDQSLSLVVLNTTGASGGYSAAATQAEPGAFAYRVAITSPASALAFKDAWESSDDNDIGSLLGFPDCCRAFFLETWVDGEWRDTTWPMAQQRETLVDGPVEANILLRWIGVRWVPHLPCSFDCSATAEFGSEFREVVPSREAAWMDELLDGPIEWSARNGIAEIKTPLFTISTKTDAMGNPARVWRKGKVYPEAGVKGLRFPYLREPETLREAPDTWTDNGFSSLRAMEAAHEVVVSAADSLTGTDYTVLDIGCGNGLLAKQMPGEEFFGIESDPARADAARSNGVTIVGRGLGGIKPEMTRVEGASLVLFMPGRIIEEEDSHVRALALTALRGADVLLVYAYGDWLDKQGSLQNLCRVAGMKGALTGERTGPGVAAGIWRWSDDE